MHPSNVSSLNSIVLDIDLGVQGEDQDATRDLDLPSRRFRVHNECPSPSCCIAASSLQPAYVGVSRIRALNLESASPPITDELLHYSKRRMGPEGDQVHCSKIGSYSTISTRQNPAGGAPRGASTQPAMDSPPETLITWPVTYAASSLAKNAMVPGKSSGAPISAKRDGSPERLHQLVGIVRALEKIREKVGAGWAGANDVQCDAVTRVLARECLREAKHR